MLLVPVAEEKDRKGRQLLAWAVGNLAVAQNRGC
jgi:hypothetical protein